METPKIIILDFGSQTTQLIYRRIRELGVQAEIFPHTITIAEIQKHNPLGIILSGSPYFPWEEKAPHPDQQIFELNIPILGLCYGLYLIAEHLGGKVIPQERKEYGKATLEIINKNLLFQDVPDKSTIWMNHGGEATNLDTQTEIIGSSGNTKYAAFYVPDKKYWGLQFHPEVTHTEFGTKMLENFVFVICKAEKNWKITNWIDDKISEVKSTLQDKKALCAISGGVDSTTAAILVQKAIKNNLTCVFVDTGLMRLNEPEEVETVLQKLGVNLIVVEAKNRFLQKLAGIIDPEEKRKIIGKEYIRIFEEEARKIGEIDYLIQGTIYSDKIESQRTQSEGLASKIKSHHNVGGLPEDMQLKLIEPLDELFKDEVRKVAISLGLPESIAKRHPFPGPGLAIQIMGDVTEEKLDITKRADAIVTEEIKKAGLYDTIGEIFANFVGVRTSGVKGDERAYQWMIAIRSVDPSDLMTCEWSRIPYEILATISSRIVNEVHEVNRVVYDITTKPPGTIRWE